MRRPYPAPELESPGTALNYLEKTVEPTDPESISAVILLAALVGQRDLEALRRSSFFQQDENLPELMAQAISAETE